MTATLADGTSWNQAAGCTSCIATNLLAADENQQGTKACLDETGFECQSEK